MNDGLRTVDTKTTEDCCKFPQNQVKLCTSPGEQAALPNLKRIFLECKLNVKSLSLCYTLIQKAKQSSVTL
jgi:hypothetical protein